MVDPIVKLVRKEDLVRWAMEYACDFVMKHLWYPKDYLWSEAATYCFNKNI